MTDWMSQLCAYLGVQATYCGFEGQRIEVSRDTQCAVMRAMDLDVVSEADARDMLKEFQSQASARPLPPEVIVKAGHPTDLTMATPAEWQLEAEGSCDTLAMGQGATRLSLPSLPMGIHRLRLSTGDGDHTTWVLARPARAIQLEDRLHQSRIWGVTSALYGMTDANTAQIGSFDLLGDYAAAIASHGADFLGINPVHAMGRVRPGDVVSPYSPSHRAFLNTWHCSTPTPLSTDNTDLVDYPLALRANAVALSDQFDVFCALDENAPDKQAFQAFTLRAGSPLHAFALFEAIAARHGADWRDWPAPYRDHDAKALAALDVEHADEIALTKWAQWRAETQLSQAHAKSRNAGMRVGLYLDLAVGPRLGGAETWEKGTSLINGATLGAPPDPLGPLGQSWGLAPLCPLKCRAEGYAGFARLLRANMRHAGMIRIDHVLGLMRSFWIPEGGAEGTYVSYPFEALLAVVAIESVRSNTIVVGEDLGLVPAGLRDALAGSGIYGLDVLQFMRTPKGGFSDPSKTRAQAVCAFATHDTPTITGFFGAEDVRVRHTFGGLDASTLKRTRADRAKARKTLGTSDPVAAIHRQLAQANASMVAVQLDDIAARTSQQNLPGTVDSYPNWQLKVPFTVDEIRTSVAFAQLAQDMAAHGRSNSNEMEKADDLSDCSNLAH